MNKYLKIIFCLLIVICYCKLNAQSLLSLTFPFGLPIAQNSGMSLSMGGSGCAVFDEYNVMLKNPSNLGNINKAIFSALYSIDILRVSESQSHTNFISSQPNQISVGIPLGVVGTFGLSYNLKSIRNAYFRDNISLDYADTNAVFKYGISSTGGLTSYQVGWGYSIFKLIQVGLAYQRFYFLCQQTKLSSFIFSGVQTDSRDSTNILSIGNGFSAGIMANIFNVKAGIKGEYFLESTARYSHALYANSQTTAIFDTETKKTSTLKPPPTLSLGISYDISQEWLASLDADFVFWNLSLIPDFLSNDLLSLTTGFSLGTQYIPAPNLLSPKYWEIIRYRAGFRYTQLPSKNAYEYMISLGAGLPLGKGSGVLDVSLEAGRRKNTLFGNYNEDIIRIGIGFNGGKKWSKTGRGNY